MNRGSMAGTACSVGKHAAPNGTGTFRTRAGMHQKNEYDYRRTVRLAQSGPEPETVEEALDLPEVIERMIPDEAETEVLPAEITADEEIIEMVDAPEEEDPAGGIEEYEESEEGTGPGKLPVCGGVDCAPYPLVYESGDGEVRLIPDPLGVLSEEGLHPFFPEA